MNKINKQDLIKVIGVMLLAIVVLVGLYLKYNNSLSNELLNVCIEDECFILEEELYVNAWDEKYGELEVEIDEKEYDEYPTIYGDITIGSDIKEVFKTFNIKPGYAYIDMEIDAGDGETDIEKFEYKNLKFLNEEYLDVYLLFGYKKDNDRYLLVDASKLEEYFDKGKSDDIDVLFGICINGMDDETVEIGEVISLYISILD